MLAESSTIRRGLPIATIAVATIAWALPTVAGDLEAPGQVRRAIAYLDSRQEDWSRFGGSGRGEGATRTTCLSCHTGISFALARPSIGRFVGGPPPTALEEKTIAEVSLRVEHWGELDSPKFRLMYDHDPRKKIESRGTEAVLDTLILARNDALRGRPEPTPTTRTALLHLWETQATEGPDAGSWDWLNFGLEPWEGEGSRAFGATLAAIAVGSAPGYLGTKLDEKEARGVERLRDYLRRRFPEESVYNRLWILEASATFPGLISADQKQEVVNKTFAAQKPDGGWALAPLGDYQRVDGSTRSEDSDGYATGLAVHAMIRVGQPADRPEIVKALGWLRGHQQADGSWPGISVNKKRDPSTFTGKLMTDAATAIAALAIVEAESPSGGDRRASND